MRDHERMMLAERRQTLWTHFVNVMLGIWLITSPAALGLFEPTTFSDTVLRVTAERGLSMPGWRSAAIGSEHHYGRWDRFVV